MNIRDYFGIKELVCPHVYDAWGENAWKFLDDRLLDTLLVIREKIDKPIVVNNWAKGGNYSQRGLRCNVCQLVREKSEQKKVYVTAHLQGKAVDFSVNGMTAEEVRRWIVKNQILLPYPVRLESDVTWVHLDVRNDGAHNKVLFF
ncbi:MAG: hypothetical protein ACI36Z_10055 [Alloprevotella sp.]